MNGDTQHPEPKKSGRFSRFLFGLFLAAFFGFVGFLFGYATPRTVPATELPLSVEKVFQGSGADVDINVFESVWDSVRQSYLHKDEVTAKEKYYGILKGLVASLGDPYSIFLNPEETDSFSKDLSGSFEGIGAEIGIRNDSLTIISPLSGSPAEKAGLLANDKIVAIDGESTASMDLNQAVSKIQGEAGTSVELAIVRGDGDPRVISVERQTIDVDSVTLTFDGSLAIIELSGFTEDTKTELDNAVQEILLKDATGVILDMRNNPGGLLDVSVDVANVFLPKGETVVIERFADQQETIHKTARDGKLQDIPLVVLINGGSASASEIVAGALKDLDRGTIIGEKSFGKGTVQTYEVLSDGSSLKLTVAEWLTPDGTSFDGEGIAPDTLVEMTEEDYTTGRDPQLDEAKNQLP